MIRAPRRVSLGDRLYGWLLLLVGGAVAFVSLWIVLPIPSARLLPLAVLAPEMSPWVMVLGAGVVALAALRFRHNPALRVAMASGVLATALALLPIVQLSGTAQRFDRDMAAALGPGHEARVPAAVRARWRETHTSVADLLRGARPDQVRETFGVPFAAPAGVTLRTNVFRPASGGLPAPILVVIYGGAWRGGSPSQAPQLSRYLASRGYAVFAVDYRHAPAFRHPAELEDVRTAIAWVRAHASEYGADSSRLSLLGRSAGGHLALLAAYEPGAGRVRAVIDFYGPADLAGGYAHPPRPDPLGVRPIIAQFLGGTPLQVPAQYRDASPITYVRAGLPPTLILHGARDHYVLADFSRDLDRRLRASGDTSVLLELPWSEHGFDFAFQGIGGQLATYEVERFLDWANARP
ncbi:MAG: alpha/beta hydrolase fold domain-containing protein [Gemmatimonadaceae bacterium]